MHCFTTTNDGTVLFPNTVVRLPSWIGTEIPSLRASQCLCWIARLCRAQYKLFGDEAVTNFDLSENEKEEVMELEWEDLVLNLQLRGLPKATLCE